MWKYFSFSEEWPLIHRGMTTHSLRNDFPVLIEDMKNCFSFSKKKTCFHSLENDLLFTKDWLPIRSGLTSYSLKNDSLFILELYLNLWRMTGKTAHSPTGDRLLTRWGMTSYSLKNDFLFIFKWYPIPWGMPGKVSQSLRYGISISENIYFVTWGMTSYFFEEWFLEDLTFSFLEHWFLIPWGLTYHSLMNDLSFLEE